MTDRSKTAPALANVTALFFAWGFVTAMIDPLIPTVKAVFELSYTEALLTQFAFFAAYGVVSLPAAAALARLGYVRAILVALAAMVLGCLLIPLATHAGLYAGVLGSLFVIAGGITLLQVTANPLAAALGDPAKSHFRLTLTQAFNSLGTVVAPFLGAVILLEGGVFAAGGADGLAARAESLRKIDFSFLTIAGLIAALGVFLWFVRGRIAAAAPATDALASPLAAFRAPWALAGALAIFLYVGAEVSVGSIMINFLSQPGVFAITEAEAGRLLSLYWGGALVGRFAGSALLTRVHAGWLLSLMAVGASLLCLAAGSSAGVVAGVAALAIGLCNAVMFPTIFTLTLERSSAPAAATSGLLCMAIVGGALLPLTVGRVADIFGLAAAFFVPACAYLGIAGFAFAAARYGPARSVQVGALAGH